MKQSNQQIWSINQLFILLATLSIVFVVLKHASGLFVPFLIAIAIAIVLSPLLDYLQARRIPKAISLVFIVLLSLLPVIALGGYVGEEAKAFAANFHMIQQQFYASIDKLSGFLGGMGIEVSRDDINMMLEKSNIGEVLKNLASQAGSQFSNIFLIFFTAAFMLMESDYLYSKMMKIMEESGRNAEGGMEIIEKIKSYFLIKVKTSLMTALWVLAVLWYYDVGYYYLWATLAFFLNFIPVIGSILAAIPAVAMAVIDQTWMTAFWVALWYVIINTVVGNILEPRIMGKGLGLSALAIFLSMTFWGWIFGPAGMILSVPLTMVIQFLFAQYQETKWVAFMLSDYEGVTPKKEK
ncbi:MAG: AI-2E family transporter [Campylobacterota bacterium]|nr:AI-2E family transporter [Campylobacterota bacterium]